MLSRFHPIPEHNGQTDLLYQYCASVCVLCELSISVFLIASRASVALRVLRTTAWKPHVGYE